MQKVLNILLMIVIAGTAWYGWRQYNLTPCDTTLEYSLGRFDTNFGITESQFLSYVSEAEVPWEDELGKQLFKYNPQAKFKVNLIYDERQRETVTKQRAESGLESAESTLRSLDKKLDTFRSQYDSRSKEFDKMKSDLEELSAEYESEVSYWNANGGAPKQEYEKLEAKRIAINRAINSLNNEASALNGMSKQLNVIVDERNDAAKSYNGAVEIYNDRFGTDTEFNQAEYDGREINVYQFNDRASLSLALAHEFGHSLGMEHVENAQSVMYYLRDSHNTNSKIVLTDEDKAELARSCKL